MEVAAIVYLTESNDGIPYFSFQFDDYELPLFGDDYLWGNKEIPKAGQICSKNAINGQWCKVGTFSRKNDVIILWLNQIGEFKGKSFNDSKHFNMHLQPIPTNPIELLGYNAKLKEKIPPECEMYQFITSSKLP